MHSENVGVVGLLKGKRNQFYLSGPVTAIHCIRKHCVAKSLQMKEVVDVVVKTVFYTSKKSQAQAVHLILCNLDTECGKLLYHTEVGG